MLRNFKNVPLFQLKKFSFIWKKKKIMSDNTMVKALISKYGWKETKGYLKIGIALGQVGSSQLISHLKASLCLFSPILLMIFLR